MHSSSKDLIHIEYREYAIIVAIGTIWIENFERKANERIRSCSDFVFGLIFGRIGRQKKG